MTRHGNTSGPPHPIKSPYGNTHRGGESKDPMRQWLPINPSFATPDTLQLLNLALESNLGLLKRGDAERLAISRRGSVLKTFTNTPAGRTGIRAFLADS